MHAALPALPSLRVMSQGFSFREVPPTVPILFSLSLPQARRPDSGQDEAWGGQGLFGVTATPVALCTLQRPGKGGPVATKRSLSRACSWCLVTVCVAGDVPVQERRQGCCRIAALFQSSLPSPRGNFGVSAVNYMCPGGLGC